MVKFNLAHYMIYFDFYLIFNICIENLTRTELACFVRVKIIKYHAKANTINLEGSQMRRQTRNISKQTQTFNVIWPTGLYLQKEINNL